MQQVRQSTVTILNGTSLSTASVDLRNEQLVGIIMPAAWDAAALSFQGSIDGSTWGNVFLATGEMSFPSADVAVSNLLAFDIHITPAIRFVKVRSGLSAAAVTQNADRVITLLTRDMVQ
jgi:hypothetical protein